MSNQEQQVIEDQANQMLSQNDISTYGIIALVVIVVTTGLITYNIGVKDE